MKCNCSSTQDRLLKTLKCFYAFDRIDPKSRTILTFENWKRNVANNRTVIDISIFQHIWSYKIASTGLAWHFKSNCEIVKMANSKHVESRQSQYSDDGSIYYHCTALKKLIENYFNHWKLHWKNRTWWNHHMDIVLLVGQIYFGHLSVMRRLLHRNRNMEIVLLVDPLHTGLQVVHRRILPRTKVWRQNNHLEINQKFQAREERWNHARTFHQIVTKNNKRMMIYHPDISLALLLLRRRKREQEHIHTAEFLAAKGHRRKLKILILVF